MQQKLTDLKACTPDSTDPKCKNADKKIAVLTRVDTHLQKVIQAMQELARRHELLGRDDGLDSARE